MPKLTAHQACSEIKDLWTEIALEAQKGKHRKKRGISGPWQRYYNQCPCCQYVYSPKVVISGTDVYRLTSLAVFLDCQLCPMAPEWKSFDPLDQDNSAENYFDQDNSAENYFCETHITPFLKWSSGPKHYSCYDLAFFAWLIVDLAEEAMERIKKEEGIAP